jgi:hypothetical protein
MTRIKTRLILGAVLGILGLGWAVLGARPLSAAGVGNLCDGKFLFKMNIIGVDQAKNPPMNNPDRKTIFVRLGPKGGPAVESDIFLVPGPFSVCDANSWDAAHYCDGTLLGNNIMGSVFQLPCNLNLPAGSGPTALIPCTVSDSACYDVYFRALGTPGGGVTISTCGQLADGTRVCSGTGNNTGLISRGTKKPTFTKVTNELTSVVGCVTVNNVTTCGRFALFTAPFQFFLWQYDNQGLKNGMVVFCGAECP